MVKINRPILHLWRSPRVTAPRHHWTLPAAPALHHRNSLTPSLRHLPLRQPGFLTPHRLRLAKGVVHRRPPQCMSLRNIRSMAKLRPVSERWRTSISLRSTALCQAHLLRSLHWFHRRWMNSHRFLSGGVGLSFGDVRQVYIRPRKLFAIPHPKFLSPTNLSSVSAIEQTKGFPDAFKLAFEDPAQADNAFDKFREDGTIPAHGRGPWVVFIGRKQGVFTC